MILSSARLALSDILSPPFRTALWKTLGLTALALIALWFGIGMVFEWFAVPLLANLFPDMPAWVDQAGTVAGWAAGLALAIALAFLIGPISAVIASLFLDDVAEVVESRSYPEAPNGVAMPFLRGLVLSAKFFGIVILGNIIAFSLLLVPGINIAAFFLVNGYLLGREYFEFAALRYRPEQEAKTLRARYSGTAFFAGLVIAGFMAVPILNLLTPLFAASFMVHLHQRVARKEGGLRDPRLTRAVPGAVREAREAVPARRSS